MVPQTLSELTGPPSDTRRSARLDHDLTRQHDGRAARRADHPRRARARRRRAPGAATLVEVWQANAAGRYVHRADRHPAPLDPNFSGAGRCLTDADGRYRFVTIKPGAYPLAEPRATSGGPRTSTSRSSGRAFATRLVTQMYFPGDPLFFQDPIFNSVRDPAARERDDLRASTSSARCPSGRSAFRFDIVLRGRAETPR